MRCSVCHQTINKKEKYCCLNTYLEDDCIEEKWFHLECYINWYKQNVEIAAKQAFKDSMNYAVKGIMENPMIAEQWNRR